MKTAAFFTSDVLHGNVSRMLGGLARGLAGQDVKVFSLHVGRPDVGRLIEKSAKDGTDFYLSMTGLGLDLDPNPDRNLFNRIGRPLVSIYLDPLLGYADQVDLPIRRRVVTTISDGDLDYWRAVAPGVDIRHLPHAAEPAAGKPWAERDIAVLFPASGCDDPEQLRDEWNRHGPAVTADLNAVLEAYLHAPLEPLTTAIAKVLGGRLDVNNPRAIHAHFATVEIYLRARARWRLLKSLKGLPVCVAGGGWEPFAARHPDHGFVFLGARPADEIQGLMARAKIVLNVCTGFHGTHERVFDAQAAGAAAATTPTRWFRDHAPKGAVVTLDETTAAETLNRLLARGGDAKRIAAAGRAWQTRHHTWAHRARDLLAWIEAA